MKKSESTTSRTFNLHYIYANMLIGSGFEIGPLLVYSDIKIRYLRFSSSIKFGTGKKHQFLKNL